MPNKIKPEWIEEWFTSEYCEVSDHSIYPDDQAFDLNELADFLNVKLKESYLPYHDSKESKLVDGEIVEEDEDE